ncbi:MAG: metallophosphoesterase [Dehalogenimonas sp.]
MTAVAILNDTHDPFNDPITDKLVEDFLREYQPATLVFNGDAIDFYALSKFDKDPKRLGSLQDDLDKTAARFARYRAILPDAFIYYNLGNHEDRLRRIKWNKIPEMASLRCLELPSLLKLKDSDVTMVEADEGIIINESFLVMHGELISKHSSYTAKAHYDKCGGCGLVGHSHRGGSFYKSDDFGDKGWYENFCLCDLHPSYDKHPNWMQGFSMVHFSGSRFHVEPIQILKHQFIYGGKVFAA